MRGYLFRDVGKWFATIFPKSEGFLKAIYRFAPSFFQDDPAAFLARYFAGSRRVNFIQIGAHDGVAGDPVRPNVLANEFWSGTLVEPNPQAFAQLKKNYQGRQRLQFRCAAVSDRSGVLPFYVFQSPDDGAAIPSWWTEISSFDQEHVLRYLPEHYRSSVITIDVPVLTLSQIVSESENCGLDLIVMDVEGHEPIILQDIGDNGMRPNVIVFEHIHIPKSSLDQFINEFRSFEYHVKLYGRDAIFFHAFLKTGFALRSM